MTKTGQIPPQTRPASATRLRNHPPTKVDVMAINESIKGRHLSMLATIILLLILGVLAIGLEFFLPGGILGLAGVGCLAGGVVLCFTAYGPSTGLVATALVAIFFVASLVLWLKYFHRIGPGRDLMLNESVKADQGLDRYQDFLHAEGVTKTALRPAGKAQFGNRRLDVLAESGMIEEGDTVRVVKVEGSRVVVRSLSPEADAS